MLGADDENTGAIAALVAVAVAAFGSDDELV